jgi:hypothetical protein
MKRLSRLLLVLISLLFASHVSANCDDPNAVFPCSFGGELPTDQCGVMFEAGNECNNWIEFLPTTSEDCAEGLCSFSGTEDGIHLQGARIVIDFISGWVDINSCGIDVSLQDNCGVGCTRLFLYSVEWDWDEFVAVELLDQRANTTTGMVELFEFEHHYFENVRLIISSCDALLLEQFATWNLVPVSPSTWSTVKSIY